MTNRTLNEKLALKILANEGIEAIWRLHVAAADAYREGCPSVAASVTEIAEAAEGLLLRAKEVTEQFGIV
jgi:aspartate aminotransferase-like enzyme